MDKIKMVQIVHRAEFSDLKGLKYNVTNGVAKK